MLKKLDTYFKNTILQSETIINALLFLVIPLNIYNVYYVFKRAEVIKNKIGSSDMKIIYSIISFFGFTHIALALLFDKIEDSKIETNDMRFIKKNNYADTKSMEALEKLGDLHKKGLISDVEFEEKRKKYLDNF